MQDEHICWTDDTLCDECGEKFTARLLSQAQALHDAHTGYVAPSHTHTAQLLEG